MKKLLSAALLALACFVAPAVAQQAVGYQETVSGKVVIKPVTPNQGLPITCISGCSGGGGGGSSDPFAPSGNASLSVSTTSARVALATADDTTLVQNLGSVTAYVALGDSTVAATTSSTPVPPGMAIALDANTSTHIAAITASSTTTLAITTGLGIPTFGLALDNSSPVPVSDNGGSLTVDGTVSVSALPAGTNNIGDVDVLTLPSLPAGTNNIGDVDVLTLPALPTGSNTIGKVNIGTQDSAFQVVGNTGALGGDSGFPVKIGCVYTTAPTTLTSGWRSDVQCNTKGGLAVSLQDVSGNYMAGVLSPGAGRGDTTDRKLAVLSYGMAFNGTSWDQVKGSTVGTATQPYGIRSSRWSYAAASGGILNTTTAVTIAPAAGAGLRNCLVSLDLMAEALGTATEVAIRDGAGGTVIYRTKIGTAGLPGRDVNLDAPICGTANTLLEAVTLTASGTGAVYLNATGNIEP